MSQLDITKRSKTDNVELMRINGMVPGVVYGANIENTSISFAKNVFEKLLRDVGETTPVDLNLEGKTIQALIHDVQFDPVKGFPLHVDFLAVDAHKKTHVTVPIEYTGIAPAQKSNIGNLVKVLHEIEIKALPKDIPHSIIVDVSTMDSIDSQITVGEIALPNGVELVTKKEDIVASIAEMKEESDSTPVDLGSIEVQKKGKKEITE